MGMLASWFALTPALSREREREQNAGPGEATCARQATIS